MKIQPENSEVIIPSNERFLVCFHKYVLSRCLFETLFNMKEVIKFMNETILRVRDNKRIANLDLNKSSFKVTIRSVQVLNACMNSSVFNDVVFKQHEYVKHNVKRIYFTCVFTDLTKKQQVINSLLTISNTIINNELITLSDKWYSDSHTYENYVEIAKKNAKKEQKALKSVKVSTSKKSASVKRSKRSIA